VSNLKTTLMRNRIWFELVDSRYYLEYLGFHIKKLETSNKWIDNTFTLLSFGGIAGWFKVADYSVLWASLLSVVSGARLMKSKFMTSESEISTLKSVNEFYIDHTRKLEVLWIQYENSKLTDDNADASFEKLRDDERLMMKINKHNKIERKEPIMSKAVKCVNEYLKRIEV
jgi:hypothetical protein